MGFFSPFALKNLYTTAVKPGALGSGEKESSKVRQTGLAVVALFSYYDSLLHPEAFRFCDCLLSGELRSWAKNVSLVI